MNDIEQKVLEDIDKHGWHVVKVFDPKGEKPKFAYSVGLHKNFNQPEIVVMGLDLEIAHKFINNIGNEIRLGKVFVPNIRYDQFIEKFDVQFVSVSKQYYKEYFGWAIWYYKSEDFPVIQFVWPDKKGKFPGEVEFNPELKNQELLLDK